MTLFFFRRERVSPKKKRKKARRMPSKKSTTRSKKSTKSRPRSSPRISLYDTVTLQGRSGFVVGQQQGGKYRVHVPSIKKSFIRIPPSALTLRPTTPAMRRKICEWMNDGG